MDKGRLTLGMWLVLLAGCAGESKQAETVTRASSELPFEIALSLTNIDGNIIPRTFSAQDAREISEYGHDVDFLRATFELNKVTGEPDGSLQFLLPLVNEDGTSGGTIRAGTEWMMAALPLKPGKGYAFLNTGTISPWEPTSGKVRVTAFKGNTYTLEFDHVVFGRKQDQGSATGTCERSGTMTLVYTKMKGWTRTAASPGK